MWSATSVKAQERRTCVGFEQQEQTAVPGAGAAREAQMEAVSARSANSGGAGWRVPEVQQGWGSAVVYEQPTEILNKEVVK